MSYTALYRKLRPKAFDDVVGQQHIIKTLKNQIQTNRISHAYLFCGTRGTGKTSTAKIFAKAVNCLENKDGEPCGICQTCENISRNMNVIEIDAASNNGVDNIRELREEVKYSPTEGRFKVYIIDEVHMLSIGAFNALLKTLEEPPEHVIFVLATTEVQKIPATIMSRCQRFDFKRISINDMSDRIKKYTETENIDIEENALRYIARLSDGAMRDALSILDQCVAFYYKEKITISKVHEIVGSVDNDVLDKMINALISFNSISCLKIIEEIMQNGRDIVQFNSDFISHLRNILVVKTISDNSALDMSTENFDILKQLSEKIDGKLLVHYINTFSGIQNQIRFSSNPKIIFEITCIKLCNPEVDQNLEIGEALKQRLNKIELKLQSGNYATEKKTTDSPPSIIKEKAVSEDIKKVISEYKSFLETVNEPLLRESLKLCEVSNIESDILYLIYDIASDKFFEAKLDLIKELIDNYFNKDIKLKVINRNEFDERHKQNFGYAEEKLIDFSEIKNKLNL